MYADHIGGSGIALFEKCCELELQGIVTKVEGRWIEVVRPFGVCTQNGEGSATSKDSAKQFWKGNWLFSFGSAPSKAIRT